MVFVFTRIASDAVHDDITVIAVVADDQETAEHMVFALPGWERAAEIEIHSIDVNVSGITEILHTGYDTV